MLILGPSPADSRSPMENEPRSSPYHRLWGCVGGSQPHVGTSLYTSLLRICAVSP